MWQQAEPITDFHQIRPGDAAAFGFGLRTPNNTGLRAGVGLKEVQQNFNPAMGHVNRVALAYQQNREVVQRPFTLYSEPGRQVVVPAGDYEFAETTLRFNTANQRQFSGSLSFTDGDFYAGKRNNINASFTWIQSRNFVLSMSQDWNAIELPQGDFITRLSSLSTQVAFSSTLVLGEPAAVRQPVGRTRCQYAPAVDSARWAGRLHRTQLQPRGQGQEQFVSLCHVRHQCEVQIYLQVLKRRAQWEKKTG